MAGAVETKWKEVDYMQRSMTAGNKAEIVAEVNAKLADGWMLIHTDHRFVGTTSAEIFHVFAR